MVSDKSSHLLRGRSSSCWSIFATSKILSNLLLLLPQSPTAFPLGLWNPISSNDIEWIWFNVHFQKSQDPFLQGSRKPLSRSTPLARPRAWSTHMLWSSSWIDWPGVLDIFSIFYNPSFFQKAPRFFLKKRSNSRCVALMALAVSSRFSSTLSTLFPIVSPIFSRLDPPCWRLAEVCQASLVKPLDLLTSWTMASAFFFPHVHWWIIASVTLTYQPS